ncbi:MAG: polysialyltransferase family glycosyltransferase [Arcobacteraceae bacterium]|nr:polysialyltransferase family glycosyltransferase [Arcobacteraceae bacterium]
MSMKLKNLFIIRSPIQVINALEAINYFQLTNNVVILIYNSLDTNTKQIKELLNNYNWLEIIELEDGKKSKFFDYVKLIKRLKVDSYNYLFFGNFGSIQRAIIANVMKNNVFYLDDGTATVRFYNNFFKNNRINSYDSRMLRFLFFGLKIKIKDTINFFTYFDLKPFNNVIIKNTLSYFKKTYFFESKKDDLIYFLGQPLERFLDLDIYKKVLLKLSKKYKQKFIYIPHRAETNVMRKEIKKLQNDLFEIKFIDVPIEVYFIQERIVPDKVFSFFSTALTTLSFLLEQTEFKHIELTRDMMIDKKYFDISLKDYYSSIEKDKIITLQELEI